MKQLKMIAASALAVAALAMAFGAGSASATTLEIAGETQNQNVWVPLRLAPFTSTILRDTAGFSKNTCTTSRISPSTVSPYTGSSVTAWVIGFTFEGCTRPVTVHWAGSMEFTYTSGTNATVASEEAVWTVGSAIGTLTCNTGTTTNIGTLTGKGWGGWTTLHVNAVLNCGIVPSAKWEGTYELEHGEGVGVSA
jgi:hypothetical protein